MDLENMTDEEYFGHMKTLFHMEGWTILLAELKSQADNIGDIQDISSLETLYAAKGKLSVIGSLLNFQETLARAENEQREAEEDLFGGEE